MHPNTSRENARFLHGRGSASVALGIAVLLLVMDFVPLPSTVSSTPSWMKAVLIPLFIAAMAVAIWQIRSLWESIFLGIFTADLSLKAHFLLNHRGFSGVRFPLFYGVLPQRSQADCSFQLWKRVAGPR